MTRIRYKLNNKGFLISTGIFLIENKFAKISLDERTLTYIIQDAANLEILASGDGKSLHGLKKKVKNTLIGMGANFGDEIRQGGKERLYG